MEKILQRIVVLVMVCNLAVHVCECQLIEGKVERCEEEGRIMEVPLLSNNPCFTCMCRAGTIQCEREVCPAQYPCVHLLERKENCCYNCFGCTLGSFKFSHDDQWREQDDSGECVEHVCKDGIVTRESRQCHVTCSDPLAPISGECGCPLCEGCIHNGVEVNEGASFSPDTCIDCVCTSGQSECKRRVCPVLVCEKHLQRFDDDGCCLTCTGKRLLYVLPNGGCWFGRGFLNDADELKVDDCTKCLCKNGTLLCDRQVCKAELDCAEQDLIRDGCCPRCPERHFLNCTDANQRLIEHGDSWKNPQDPCLSCSCRNGIIECDRETCPESKSCSKGEVADKLPGSCCATCQPEPGICSVFGDPHYRTFDGRTFNFQGDCRYVLTRDCLGRNFSVVVENNAKRSPLFAWTNSVHLKLFNQDHSKKLTVSLFQHLGVKINGQRVALPHISQAILVWVEHHVVRVRTDAGISLNWDGDSFLEVGAASVYRGSLCGLCGNFNGFDRDDFIGRDGSFKFDQEEFAKSWKVGHKNKHCSRRFLKPRSVSSCGSSLQWKVAARRSCQVFKSKDFRACYSSVDPFVFYRACLTDMCECPRTRKCSCESIRAYASACFRQGVRIRWNEAGHCKRPCSHGKVYSTCGSTCKRKCKTIHRRRKNVCRRSCAAGCFCPAGFATRGRKCVKISKCYSKRAGSRRTNHRMGNPLQRYLKT